MPYCPKCGKEVSADVAYCHYCGSPIRAPSPAPSPPTVPKREPQKIREEKIRVGVIHRPTEGPLDFGKPHAEKQAPQVQQAAGPVKKKAIKIQKIVGVATGIIIFIMVLSVIPRLYLPNATYHLNQGNTFYNEGKYEQAVAEYSKAIELDPGLASAYHNRGLAYYKMEQYDLALADFNKTIELDPKMSTAWVGKGISLERLGKYKEALEAYNKALEVNPNDQSAKDNKDRLLAYIASLPITYNGGQFGLKTTTTQTLGELKIARTVTCTTYGYPFDLKLYRVVLSGQTIYVGMAETTLHYEGDWSVTATPREVEGYLVKIEVSPSSGHVSGNVKAVISGVWQGGTVTINGKVGPQLGLMILIREIPDLQIWCEIKESWYRLDGTLELTITRDCALLNPFSDVITSFTDASLDSSPYLTEGKLPSIPTDIEEISKMELDEYLSLVGYKWTKIQFSSATTLDAYFSGAPASLNPPMNPDSKSEYNGHVGFESNFIPDP